MNTFKKTTIIFFGALLASVTTANAQLVPSGDDLVTNKQVGLNTIPTARMDIKLQDDFIARDESGLRVTYPNVAVSNGSRDNNYSIFEVRRKTFGNNHKTNFIVKRSGRVGIGTGDPDSRFDIRMPNRDEIIVRSETPNTYTGINFQHSDGTENWRLRSYSNFGGGYENTLGLISASGGNFWIAAPKTIIGDFFDFDPCTDCDEFNLFVKRGIRTERVKVDVASGLWADYVFNEDYVLKPLNEVEAYINENGHLPGVPSAEEMEVNGMDVAKANALLLEKIEELTLYMIEMQKQNEKLTSEIEKLKK